MDFWKYSRRNYVRNCVVIDFGMDPRKILGENWKGSWKDLCVNFFGRIPEEFSGLVLALNFLRTTERLNREYVKGAHQVVAVDFRKIPERFKCEILRGF